MKGQRTENCDYKQNFHFTRNVNTKIGEKKEMNFSIQNAMGLINQCSNFIKPCKFAS